MEADTREFAPMCTACGSEHNGPSFLGECLRCYADAMAHGGEYETIDALTDFLRGVLADTSPMRDPRTEGELTKADERTVRDIASEYGMTFANMWP